MAINAATVLADELKGISKEDRTLLKESLPDLLHDGPRAVLAESRFKKVMAKAGRESYDAMKTILVEVASEAVKKSLFGV
jgi:hypothetical protein